MSYLAIARVGAGGSWAREETADKAVMRVASIVVEDWGSLYALEGEEIDVALYNVGDRPTASRRGMVTDAESGEEIECTEVRSITLRKRR